MADNVTIPATGTGDAVPVVATDQIGSAHHQLVKIEFGVLDSATMVSASNPLPVVQTGTPALPTGAALDATNTANGVLIGAVLETAPASDTASSGLNGRLQRIAQRLSSLIALLPTSLGQKTMANGLAVTIASDQSTVPVSAASLPLPSGASTSAKQPALGTAGTPSADVLTVQGVASMTALKVDGSAVTQPVSGSVTANIGTSGSLALDATLTGGTQKTKLVDTGGTNVGSISAAGALKVDGSAVTQPVSGTISVSGTMPTAEVRATTSAAPTAFTATTSTQVFASNANRKMFTVYNNSDKDLYLMLAAAAVSTTSFHVKVTANGGYFSTTDYSGEIRGILNAAITTGQVNPGEFT